MKRYTATFMHAIAFVLIASSCQDINLSPKDNIDDRSFWRTPTDYMKAVNQLYSRTEAFDVKDADSDIAYELNPNSTSNGTANAPNGDPDWTDRFADLRDCNKIIEKSTSYAGDASEIARYVAEARFFRAYNHWRLMRKFNDVPIITKVLATDSPELYAAREPQASVEDFILSELEAAAANLPKQSELGSDELGRVTQGAALALKARVALFAGTWAKYHQHRSDHAQLLDQAIDAAQRVAVSNEYRLYEGSGNESYRRLFIDEGEDAAEAIFSSRFAKDIRMHSTAHSVFWGWRGTPTKKLADLYLSKTTGLPIDRPNSGFQGYEKIADEFANRDPRMTQTFLMPGTVFLNAQHGRDSCVAAFTTRPETRTGYKLWKFMGETRGGNNDDTYDYHIIRYPEVLLIWAEAAFEKDEAISDELLANTINVVRSRMGVEMPPLTNAFVNSNGLDMRTEIRRERTVELAFEGFRRDDLRRWKTAETELKAPLKGIKYQGTQYEALQVLNDGNPGLFDAEGFLIVEPASARLFETPKHYYFPVPLDETYLNPNLLPNNPGW
ncbi:RagB/SusD family nutrient uptake outer membrane protein [Parapedobacter pyrenivorans]|uniref:RagB/SusD family nutrient uptake outer membrane protein n=1 Tax=Parapedobacter pyrenivorans TaxID=1305674 RepID=UPI003341801B